MNKQLYSELLTRNEQLKAENASLRRQLERAEMWERSFASDVRKIMSEEIERLQIERDEAVRRLNNIYLESEEIVEEEE